MPLYIGTTIREGNKMLEIVIFSKDRPCQLDLLLRSIRDHFNYGFKIHILYKYTNEEYMKGYNLLESFNYVSNTNFVLENLFYEDVVSIVGSIPERYICFLVDDDVIFRAINDLSVIKLLEDPNVLTVSTRLGLNTNHCYPVNITTGIPTIVNNCWCWRSGAGGDWSYPMSLDGNIFRKEEIVQILNKERFNGPNELEGKLCNETPNRALMACYPESKTINIPANKTQSVLPNRCADSFSIKELNDLYLNGYKIKTDNIYTCNNNSPHYEITYEFTRE